MLVLTRKLGESIVIDDEIVVKVTAVQGNRVKLSLDAPVSRRIMRGEIAEGVKNSPAPPQEESGWGRTGTESARPTPVPPTRSHAK